MRVFHRTSRATADGIRESGRFVSREADRSVYVSNRVTGEAAGFGAGIVRLDIPVAALILDDEFPGGERHYRINAADIRPEWIIR